MSWMKEAVLKHRPELDVNPAFKAWFGNSKVVDGSGKPLIVYKGMYPYDWTVEPERKELDTIQRTEPFPSFDSKDTEPVHLAGFFTDDPSIAAHFAFDKGGVYPCYLRIERPKVFHANGRKAGEIQFGPSGKEFRDAIRSGQYDGVIILNTIDEGNLYIPLLKILEENA